MVATHGHLTQKDFLGGGWVRSLNLTGWVGNLEVSNLSSGVPCVSIFNMEEFKDKEPASVG